MVCRSGWRKQFLAPDQGSALGREDQQNQQKTGETEKDRCGLRSFRHCKLAAITVHIRIVRSGCPNIDIAGSRAPDVDLRVSRKKEKTVYIQPLPWREFVVNVVPSEERIRVSATSDEFTGKVGFCGGVVAEGGNVEIDSTGTSEIGRNVSDPPISWSDRVKRQSDFPG